MALKELPVRIEELPPVITFPPLLASEENIILDNSGIIMVV